MEHDFTELSGSPVAAARRLLGCELIRTIGERTAVIRIVETEAYHQTDAASHSYKGRTPRTDVMFGPAGHLYVYFTYGMHYCMNIVSGPAGEGSGVLIRAVEPVSGVDVLEQNRPTSLTRNLTNGPAKLCQALAVDRTMNGHDLHEPPLVLQLKPPIADGQVVQTTRVGISQATEKPWRFYIQGNPFVSKI